MKFLRWIFQFVFGCHHSKLGGVFTIKKRAYQVCFGVWTGFVYSWALMRSILMNRATNTYAPRNSARHADLPIN